MTTSSSSSGEHVDLEEEIIKRRLVIDGDGRGDEKKYRVLLQSYVSWVTSNNPAENDDASTLKQKNEENEKGRKRFLKNLGEVKLIAKKNVETISAVQATQGQYADLQAQIKEEINNQRQLILQLKENSSLRKRAQQQKMECEAVMKLLERLPDRKKKEAQLKKLNGELAKLQAQRNEMDCKIAIQKQKLSVLIQTSRDLARIVSEDDAPTVREDLARSTLALGWSGAGPDVNNGQLAVQCAPGASVHELAVKCSSNEVVGIVKPGRSIGASEVGTGVLAVGTSASTVANSASAVAAGASAVATGASAVATGAAAVATGAAAVATSASPVATGAGASAVAAGAGASAVAAGAGASAVAAGSGASAVNTGAAAVATSASAVGTSAAAVAVAVGTCISSDTRKRDLSLPKISSTNLGNDVKVVKFKTGRYQIVNKTYVSSQPSKFSRCGPKQPLESSESNANTNGQNKSSKIIELGEPLLSNDRSNAPEKTNDKHETENSSIPISPSPFMFRTLDTRNLKTVHKPSSPAKGISLGDVIKSQCLEQDTTSIIEALLADAKHLIINQDLEEPIASSSSRINFKTDSQRVLEVAPLSNVVEAGPAELAVGYQELIGIEDEDDENDTMSMITDGEDDIDLYDDIVEGKDDSSKDVQKMELSECSVEAVEERNSANTSTPISLSPSKSKPNNLITLHYESQP